MREAPPSRDVPGNILEIFAQWEIDGIKRTYQGLAVALIERGLITSEREFDQMLRTNRELRAIIREKIPGDNAWIDEGDQRLRTDVDGL